MGIKKIINKLIGYLCWSGWLGLGCLLSTSYLYANPVVDHVAAGNVSIQQTPTTTVVNQTSQKAIINWQSFNIHANETTHFQQPAGGIVLNRIDPTQGASAIYGRLTATGQVILINPAGIFFGPGSYVNVGGLVASTHNMTDQDFLNNVYHFQKVNGYNGTIINQGQLIAAEHGLIALIGGAVRNDGYIEATMGQIVLASGNAMTMQFSGNDLISFSVDEKLMEPTALADGVKNTGMLIADGGKILIEAKAATGVLDNVINMEGIAQTQSVDQQNGEIILSGDPDNGVVRVAGTLDASGEYAGNVTITGYNILLDDAALINANNVLIGGNYQGQGPLPNSNAVVMLSNAKIFGNNIILWSDVYTSAKGFISAPGGFVETSSHGYLDVNGIQVNLKASDGTLGTWLLDPDSIEITTTADNLITGSSPFEPSPADSNSTLTWATIEAALTGGTVIVQTLTGNINIAEDYDFSIANTATGTLELLSGANITADGGLTVTGKSGLSLWLNATGNATIDTDFANFDNVHFQVGSATTYSGVLSGSGTFTKSGAGNLALSNTNTLSGLYTFNSGVSLFAAGGNAVSGDLLVTGGTLTSLFSDQIANTANVTFSGTTATWNMSTRSETVNGLSLVEGVITSSTGVLTSLTDIDAQSGVSTATLGGSAGIIKTTSGEFRISKANTFTGLVTVNGGTLLVTNGNGLGSNASGTVVNSGATLQIANTAFSSGEALTLNNGTLFLQTGAALYTGDITLGNGTTNTMTANLTGSALILSGTVNGAGSLNLTGLGGVRFSGTVGNSTPLTSITSASSPVAINTSLISTSGSQTYGGAVTLMTNTQLNLAGSSNNAITFSNGISGGFDLTLSGSGSGNHTYSLNTSLALNNLTISPSAGSSNSLAIATGSAQTWNITSNNAGNITGLTGVSGTASFSNIQNITADTAGSNTFNFSNGARLGGTLNGGSLSNTNTLNLASYNSPINITLISILGGDGTAFDNSSNTIASYSNINQLTTNNAFNNTLTLGNELNDITITSARNGFINDPVFFTNFQNIINGSGNAVINFNSPVSITFEGNTAIAVINGVTMVFTGFDPSVFSAYITTASFTTVNVADIIQQSITPSSPNSPSSELDNWDIMSLSVEENLDTLTSEQHNAFEDTLTKLEVVANCFQSSI